MILSVRQTTNKTDVHKFFPVPLLLCYTWILISVAELKRLSFSNIILVFVFSNIYYICVYIYIFFNVFNANKMLEQNYLGKFNGR